MIGKRTAFFISILVLAAFLVPLLVASFYAVPCADDYSYGYEAHRVYTQTGSVLKALARGAEHVGEVYGIWQGTYSAIFLFSVQPAIFGERLYALTGFIMLGALTAGTFALCVAVFKRIFGADKYTGATVAAAVTVVCTQLLPSPVQGFYWYNGAVYYSFFYGLSLAAFALGINYVNQNKTAALVWLCLVCAVLGGGNYVTALNCVIIAFSSMLLMLLLRDGRWKKLILPTVILLAGFGISVIAPGNAIRQSTVTEHPTAIRAVLMSFAQCAQYSVKWFSLPLVGMLALISPLLWHTAKTAKFKFRYPAAVTAYSYCLLSAMFCPPIYALGDVGEFRLLNIIYFAFVLTVTLNVFYWLGRFASKRKGTQSGGVSFLSAVAVAAVCCVCCVSALLMNTGFTSIGALSILRNGEAEAFRECSCRRLEILKDETVKDAQLPDYPIKPYILFYDDITSDPDDWHNEDMASFYGKESVTK